MQACHYHYCICICDYVFIVVVVLVRENMKNLVFNRHPLCLRKFVAFRNLQICNESCSIEWQYPCILFA